MQNGYRGRDLNPATTAEMIGGTKARDANKNSGPRSGAIPRSNLESRRVSGYRLMGKSRPSSPLLHVRPPKLKSLIMDPEIANTIVFFARLHSANKRGTKHLQDVALASSFMSAGGHPFSYHTSADAKMDRSGSRRMTFTGNSVGAREIDAFAPASLSGSARERGQKTVPSSFQHR